MTAPTPSAHKTPPTENGVAWSQMLAGPIAWTVLFLAVYVLAEFGCRGGWLTGRLAGLPAASVVVAALTAVTLAFAGWGTFDLYRRWHAAGRDTQAEDRGRFMTLAGALLGALFTLLILFTGLPAIVLEPCRTF